MNIGALRFLADRIQLVLKHIPTDIIEGDLMQSFGGPMPGGPSTGTTGRPAARPASQHISSASRRGPRREKAGAFKLFFFDPPEGGKRV